MERIEKCQTVSEFLEKALSEGDTEVREYVVKSPEMTPFLLEKALKDEDLWVRVAAVENPNMTVELLEKVVLDKNEYAREDAENLKPTPFLPAKELEEDQCSVRRAAAENQNMPVELLEKLLSDEDKYVSALAATCLENRENGL